MRILSYGRHIDSPPVAYLPIAAAMILVALAGIVVATSSEYLWLLMLPIGILMVVVKPTLSVYMLLAVSTVSFGVREDLTMGKFAYVGLFLVTYGVWIINSKTQVYRIPPSARPLVTPLIALGLLLAISMVVAVSNGIPTVDWLRDASNYANYLLILPVSGLLWSKRHTALMLVFLFATSLFTSIATISSGRFFSWGIERLPFSASVGWTLAVIVISLALLIASESIGHRSNRWFVRLGSGVVAMIAFIGLVSTGYRSALAGLAVGVAMLSLLGLRRKRFVWVQIAALLAFALLALYLSLSLNVVNVDSFLSRTLPMFTGQQSLDEDLSWIGRRNEAVSGIETFRSSPVLGQGFGYKSYIVHYGNVFRENSFFHNSYVGALAKTGLVGFIVILWMFYRFITTLLGIWRATNDLVGWFCLGLAAAIVGAGVLSFFEATLDNRTFSLMISFSIALALRWTDQSHVESPGCA